MKRLTRKQIALGFRRVLETHSHREAVMALAQILIAERRTQEIDLILSEIARLNLEREQHLTAEVITARPVTEQLKREITTFLKQFTGATTLEITERIDPTLLGGFVALTPDYEIDMSLKRTLQRLEI